MVCAHSTSHKNHKSSLHSHSSHLPFLRRPCHPWNTTLRRPVPQHQAAWRERRGRRQFPPLAVGQELLHPWFGDQICAAARFGGGHRAAAGRGAARGGAAKRRHVILEPLIFSAWDGDAKRNSPSHDKNMSQHVDVLRWRSHRGGTSDRTLPKRYSGSHLRSLMMCGAVRGP